MATLKLVTLKSLWDAVDCARLASYALTALGSCCMCRKESWKESLHQVIACPDREVSKSIGARKAEVNKSVAKRGEDPYAKSRARVERQEEGVCGQDTLPICSVRSWESENGVAMGQRSSAARAGSATNCLRGRVRKGDLIGPV